MQRREQQIDPNKDQTKMRSAARFNYSLRELSDKMFRC
jgi:hypothetical protein